MMIFEILSVAWGYAWHFFGILTYSMTNHGWARLMDFTAGVLATVPVFVISLRKTKKFTDDQIFVATCIFLFAFLLVGVGTALGWLTFPHEIKSP